MQGFTGFEVVVFAPQGHFQLTPQPSPVKDDIVLTIRPDYTLLPPDVPQIIHIWAKDSAGRPLPNVNIILYITTPSARQVTEVSPTNANGETLLKLDSVAADCAEIVRLRAVTNTADSTAWANEQFVFWCAPN